MQGLSSKELHSKYRIQSEIGRGASSVCYRVINILTKQIYAMKKIHFSSIKRNSTRQANSQISILSKIDHPNIVKLFQSFCDQNNIYIILQYASKGDLHNVLSLLQDFEKKKNQKQLFFRKINMGHGLLNVTGYIISPFSQNYTSRYQNSQYLPRQSWQAICNFIVKQLGDLGVSKIIKNQDQLYSRVGTPLYLAPQIIKYQKYDYKADIWGLGCVVYQLATFVHPFQGKNIITLGQNIVMANPKPIQNYSQHLFQFVMDMLQKNPKRRLSSKQLIDKYYNRKYEPQRIIAKTEVSQKRIQQKEQKKQNSKYISVCRINFDMNKNNMMRKHTISNNLNDQKDKILFQLEPDQKQVKNNNFMRFQQQTLILPKKYKKAQKQYDELTHKNYVVKSKDSMINQIHNRQSQSIEANKQYKQYKINRPITALIHNKGFKSQKKVNYYHNEQSSSVRKLQPQFKIVDNLKKQQNPFIQNRFSSLNSQQTFSNKARHRPKSSIMTKEKHELTMKNIRKKIIKQQILDKSVQTQYLKKPNLIIL